MGFWSRVKERMKTRNPWVSGALNFLGWGLGYLYAGRKKLVGLALFFFIVGNYAASAVFVTGGVGPGAVFLTFLLTWLFAGLALGRDAYLEAKKRNREVESE